MSIFNNPEENFWRNFITKVVLILFTVSIIVWFLPRNEGRQFRYDIGKPWMYGSVIATFDFPIYKTDESIKHEQDSLLKQFQPYYTVNTTVGDEQVKRFLHDFSQGIPGLPKEFVGLVAQQLHHVYQTGIVSTPEYNRIYKDSTSMIRIISGKNVKSVPIGTFYSTIAAYERIFFNQQIAEQRQILSRCNLNDYVEPNLIYDKERSETEKTDLLSSIPLASGMVMSGQKIIDRGEVITPSNYRVLTSFEKETKRRSSTEDELTTTIIGQVLFIFLLVIMFTSYLTLFRKDYFDKPRSITMLYAMITLFPIFVSLIRRPGTTSNEYLIVWMSCILRRRIRRSRSISFRCRHPTSERLADRQMLSRLLNLEHTVEAGIAYYIHILDTDAFEQSLALLVLHEETGKAYQKLVNKSIHD
jgi:cyclic-di-AMP phosphodiesterase PgpH